MPPLRTGLTKRKLDAKDEDKPSNVTNTIHENEDESEDGGSGDDSLFTGELRDDGDSDSDGDDAHKSDSDHETESVLYGDDDDPDSALVGNVEDVSDQSSDLTDSEEDDDSSEGSEEEEKGDESSAESGLGNTHSGSSEDEEQALTPDKIKSKKTVKAQNKDKKNAVSGSKSIDALANKIKETNVTIKPVEQKDEYESGDTSDEEDRVNTCGAVPAWWYREYAHVGYDLDGRRIMRPQQRDAIDEFLKQCEDPDFWRTVRDPATGQDIVLSKEDLELISRIRQGQVPNPQHDEYEPWTEWFSREVLATPVRAFPEHKRSFVPSREEQKHIARIVHALKMGWTKTRKQLAQERRAKKEKSFYNLWGSTASDESQPRGVHRHIPAPRRPPPTHAESYNPPPEYLLDAREVSLSPRPQFMHRHIPAPRRPPPTHAESYNPPPEYLLDAREVSLSPRPQFMHRHIPAPRRPPPTHAESYNPPPEYLLDAREVSLSPRPQFMHRHIPAPRRPPPTHAESYNPPPEYLLDAREVSLSPRPQFMHRHIPAPRRPPPTHAESYNPPPEYLLDAREVSLSPRPQFMHRHIPAPRRPPPTHAESYNPPPEYLLDAREVSLSPRPQFMHRHIPAPRRPPPTHAESYNPPPEYLLDAREVSLSPRPQFMHRHIPAPRRPPPTHAESYNPPPEYLLDAREVSLSPRPQFMHRHIPAPRRPPPTHAESYNPPPEYLLDAREVSLSPRPQFMHRHIPAPRRPPPTHAESYNPPPEYLLDAREVSLSPRPQFMHRHIPAPRRPPPTHAESYNPPPEYLLDAREVSLSPRPQFMHRHIPAPRRPPPTHAESYNPPPEYLLDAREVSLSPRPQFMHRHIPAPRRPPPTHAESYNPPPEYLLDAREMKEWRKLEQTPWKRKYTFLPTQYPSLRAVPAYERFVRERFLRCLDLYLAPRAIKMRLTIRPEQLVPSLPAPRDLQPFPTSQALELRGHSALVRSADFDPSGQYAVSGGDDGTVRVWETATGRCLRTVRLADAVTRVAWTPVAGLSVVACAVGQRLLLLNPGGDIGAHRVAARTDDLLRDPPPQHDVAVDARTAAAATWAPVAADEWALGVRACVSHFRPVSHVSWHARGDYVCVTLGDAASRAVVVHQLSRRRSQLPFARAKGIVQCAIFHPFKPLLFVATQRAVRVYDLVKQELVRKLEPGAQWISALAIHPAGDNLLVASYDRKVMWFDLELSSRPYQTLRLHGGAVRSVAFHRRYPLFATAGDDPYIVVSHGMVYNDLLQNPLLVPLKQLPGPSRAAELCVTELRFHPTQPWLLAAGADHTLRLYS